MISDARITSETHVHPLSGSTPPGAEAAEKLAAVAELPDTFTPLGDVAAAVVEKLDEARADSDEGLIAEAAALQALVRHDERLWEAVADADPEDEDARAVEAHESTGAVADASVLLAGKPARTSAAVAAKARALLEAAGANPKCWYERIHDHMPLVVSTLRDAVVLGGRATEQDGAANDARLLDLIKKHKVAIAEAARLAEAYANLYPNFQSLCPPRPSVLYWSLDDNFGVGSEKERSGEGRYRLFYDDQHIGRKHRMLHGRRERRCH